MRSFFTLTIFTALTAAAPIAHRPSRNSAQSLAGREVGIDGTCGPIWGGSTCAPGLCCSAQGYCGTSDAYCAAGCQSPFGTCGSSSSGSSAASSAPLSVPVPASSAVSLPSIVLPTSSIAAPAPTSDSAPAPVVTATSTISVLSVAPASSAAAAATSAAAPSSPSSAGSPSTNSNSGSGSSSSGSTLGLGNVFKMYNGDGSSTQGWPALSNWANFDSMWTSNMEDISNSCEWSFAVPNNSDEESANLKSAIQSVAAAADMDPRFVLAIVMQESKGCVRAPTTSYSVRNPGLMQSHNGQGTCNDDGDVQNPCPAAMITQMIEDGVQGTFQKYDSSNGQGGGAGLAQALQQVGSSGSGAQKYYMAARVYNSGSLSGDNLGAPGATACYAADVANRLTGWVTAPDTCDLDSYH